MKTYLRGLVCSLALCITLHHAGATAVNYQTGSNAVDSHGDPVSALVTVTTGVNSITVDIYNQIVNQNDAGQSISGLFVSLDGGQTSGSVTSSSAIERSVSSDGTFVDSGFIATGWGIVNGAMVASITGFSLEDLGYAGPAHTIIGEPGAGNVYSNANGSIAKSDGPHNPFLAGDTRFNLTVAGVTASTSVNALYFSFGTALGNDVPGVIAAPEPTSLALAGLGLVGIGAFARRRRA